MKCNAIKFCNKVIAIASAALDDFRNEAKKMVVALVDMERAYVPPQHFIRLVQKRFAHSALVMMPVSFSTWHFLFSILHKDNIINHMQVHSPFPSLWNTFSYLKNWSVHIEEIILSHFIIYKNEFEHILRE